MHILLIVHSLAAGGAERITSHLANHWVTLGREVTLVTLATTEDDFYPLDSRVRRIALDLVGESPDLGAALRSNLRRLRAIRKVLRQERPDYVVAMMATVTVLTTLAATGLGIPVVVSERNHPTHIPLGRAWERLRKLAYGRADGVVMLTREGLGWLTETVPKARGVVIPNPVPYPLPAGSPTLAVTSVLRDDAKLVLAVGRLAPQKGFDILINAFGEVAAEHPDWTLIILGEGKERAHLESQIHERKLSQRVLLPGRAGNMGDWYCAASLYVMSSRFEGFPNTLAEAMAHGCPVISFDCDTGPRDIIRQGEDGILVCEVADSSALASALRQAMGDEALRRRWAEKAIEVRQRFSVERILGLWEVLFTSLAGRERSAFVRHSRRSSERA